MRVGTASIYLDSDSFQNKQDIQTNWNQEIYLRGITKRVNCVAFFWCWRHQDPITFISLSQNLKQIVPYHISVKEINRAKWKIKGIGATVHHWKLNITLNASSSVRSSPIYIGSTSSQLFSPKKQCLMSVTVKQWTVINEKF